MFASTENPNIRAEIRESTRIILKAHFRHFYGLSALFLLPIFSSLVVYPSFHVALFHPNYDFTLLQVHLNFLPNEIIVSLFYTLSVVLLFLCAISTITFSAVEAFHGKPISFVSSIKSIRNSFFPLLSTLIVSHTIFISIALVFTLLLGFLVQVIGLKYDSNYLMCLWLIPLIVLVSILIRLQVNWSLAYVVSVVESKWGFEALRRSACLVKGKRWVVLWTLLIYGVVMGVMVVSGSIFLVLVGAWKGNQWRSLGVILQTLECSVLSYLLMNQYLVLNVVMYMYCSREKSPLEIGDEYVYVPLDDEKNHAIV